jgi:hypothetical protein
MRKTSRNKRKIKQETKYELRGKDNANEEYKKKVGRGRRGNKIRN